MYLFSVFTLSCLYMPRESLYSKYVWSIVVLLYTRDTLLTNTYTTPDDLFKIALKSKSTEKLQNLATFIIVKKKKINFVHSNLNYQKPVHKIYGPIAR